MLRFVLGKSGTGKTTYMYNKICELSKNGNEKLLVLVPDMNTFETEKAFLNLLGAKLSKNIKVFGFSRLCRFVFEQTLNVPQNVIDDGTRAVIMNIALEQLTEKLILLKTKKTGSLAQLMLQTLTDCKKNNISTAMLYNASNSIKNETLKAKLYETALVLDTFDAILSQSYVDPLDDLTRLYNILCENNMFEGYTVFVDSFSGFSAQQLKVLKVILNQCSSAFIALTLDPESDEQEQAFVTSYATYKTLKNLAKSEGIELKVPVKLSENKKFKNSELSVLESSIFRKDKAQSPDDPENIILYSAKDRYEECEFAARQIKRMIIKDGLLYRDITVICHDTQPYRGIIDTVFQKYEIPYFMDSESDIEVKPVIRFVNSVFRIIFDNFQRDDVMALLKTGLTSNSLEEINCFENYTYIWNVNGSDFKSEFNQNPRGFSSRLSDSDIESLKTAEKVRKSIAEPLLRFSENIKQKNGREITQLLYELLTELKVQDALSNMYDAFEDGSERGRGAEQIRVWNFLMDALDKTAAVVGDTALSPRRYYELLSIQISSIKLMKIPQTLDSVTVTTAQRVRVSNQKVTFLIGCTDGEFPSVPHSSGVFSPYELKQLSLSDVKLCEDFSSLADLEIFMAYCCMTSPSEKLYITYPCFDLLGTPYSPSVIFEETVKAFPNIKIYDRYDFNPKLEAMYSIRPAFEEYARSLCENGGGLKGLSEFFDSHPYFSSKSKAVIRAANSTPFKISEPKNAESLFGENLKISASQVQKFSLCRFAYFCSYGLNIRERRRAEINQLEYGTLVHFLLERFFGTFKKQDYSSMTDESIKAFTENALNEYSEQYFGGLDNKNKAFMYRLKIISENVFVLLKHIITELGQSDFDVADCELKIGDDIPSYTVTLPDGHSVALYGSVDRVDIMESNNVKYLRIVDYKTGSAMFNLSDILYGLNLQMLLYLYSIILNGSEKYGDVLPAGILYMPATVPVISSEKPLSDNEVKDSIKKSLKMNGLLLDDARVIKGMDKSEKAVYIPVKIDLGTPKSSKSLATLEQFGKIFKKLEYTVSSMGSKLYSGDIEAAPLKGGKDACEYCPYDSVCQYRMSSPVNAFAVSNDEVYQKIDSELEKGEK